MNKKIFIVHIKSNRKQILREINKISGESKAFFFCQDYKMVLEWNKIFPLSLMYKRLSDHYLPDAINKLKIPFLDLLSDIGEEYNSVSWWVSRFSERNTMVNSVFLYCCYLHTFRELIKNENSILFVFVENYSLIRPMKNILVKNNYHAKILFSFLDLIRKKVFETLKMMMAIIFFIANTLLKIILSGSSEKKDIKRTEILIHTYIEEKCLGNDGSFNEIYFPGLFEWLGKKEFDFAIIPVLFNLKRSFLSAWNWLSKSRYIFLNPYNYYRISDILFSIKTFIKMMKIPKGKINLEGIDITEINKSERQKGIVSVMNAILYYCLPKRLSEHGIEFKKLIMEFENMINEKMLILGFKKYSKNTKLIGFQHGALYPSLLCNYLNKEEAQFAPMPDKIICNGEIFKEILQNQGIQKEKLVVGPALRYNYIWKKSNQCNEKKYDIFVPLPLLISDAVELLYKILEIKNKLKNKTFIIKPHPMSSVNLILNKAGIKNFPQGISIVSGKMHDWIFDSKVMLSLSSCTIYESLAAGVPVVIVGRDNALDFNPLGYFREFEKIFVTPEEIVNELNRVLSLDDSEIRKYVQKGEEILKRSFNPVSEASMEVFVN